MVRCTPPCCFHVLTAPPKVAWAAAWASAAVHGMSMDSARGTHAEYARLRDNDELRAKVCSVLLSIWLHTTLSTPSGRD